jgi:hypothetical protein
MSEVRHIVPRQGGELRPYKTPDEHWREVTEEIYGSAELPETTQHMHDPEWDRRLLSIQNANDQTNAIFAAFGMVPRSTRPMRVGFWSVIAVLFVASEAMWFGFRVPR